MPSKKKYNARFPPARIKKIMQTDEDVGKVAAAVPVLISKALEIFLESLILKSSEQTLRRNAKTMSSAHIKQCIQTEVTFDFLKDLVENVPDIGQGDNEDGENNHAANNNKQQRRAGDSFSRSNSTASSSSETPVKRKRGRPRKPKAEDVAGPSNRKHKLRQSSEDQTTSEDSEISDMEMTEETNASSQPHLLQQSTSISHATTYQDTRQHQQSSGPSSLLPASQSSQPPHQPSFGLPVMPQFQVPSAPSNPTSSSLGMGHFQMPKASHAAGDEDDDEDDDYDT